MHLQRTTADMFNAFNHWASDLEARKKILIPQVQAIQIESKNIIDKVSGLKEKLDHGKKG